MSCSKKSSSIISWPLFFSAPLDPFRHIIRSPLSPLRAKPAPPSRCEISLRKVLVKTESMPPTCLKQEVRCENLGCHKKWGKDEKHPAAQQKNHVSKQIYAQHLRKIQNVKVKLAKILWCFKPNCWTNTHSWTSPSSIGIALVHRPWKTSEDYYRDYPKSQGEIRNFSLLKLTIHKKLGKYKRPVWLLLLIIFCGFLGHPFLGCHVWTNPNQHPLWANRSCPGQWSKTMITYGSVVGLFVYTQEAPKDRNAFLGCSWLSLPHGRFQSVLSILGFLSIYLSICLSVCLPAWLSGCLSVCLSVLSLCLSIYLSTYLYICPEREIVCVCACMYMYIYTHTCMYIYIYMYTHCMYVYIYLFIYSFVYLYIYCINIYIFIYIYIVYIYSVYI